MYPTSIDAPARGCLHVISTLDPSSGGTAEGLRQLVCAAVRQGQHAEIATLDPADAPWLTGLPCPVHALGRGQLGTFQFSAALSGLLARHAGRFEALVVHGLWQFQGLAARRAAQTSGVPYFVFSHGMLDPWFRRTYPLKHLKKWLYWPWGEYRVLRDAAAVLFTCEAERRLARDSFSLYRARERVVPFGTPGPKDDLTACRAAFHQRFPALQQRRMVLFLGRLHEKKGVDILVEAFARESVTHPDVELVLAGPDPQGLQPVLRARANALGCQRITFVGMLLGELKWGALACAEVFVLPSHQENFGIAVAEALACGTPVLLSDQVNIWREILDASAGWVAPDDLPGTRSLLRRWLDADDAGRRALREQARPCFERHFDIDVTARELARVVRADGRRHSP